MTDNRLEDLLMRISDLNLSEPEVSPIIGEYKNHPTITLPTNGRANKYRDLSFGLSKAKTILMYLPEIIEFVENSMPNSEV